MCHIAIVVLAERLRTLRNQAGLSQRQLAFLSQVSLRTITRIENGAQANRSTITLLAHALKVKPDVLLNNGTEAA